MTTTRVAGPRTVARCAHKYTATERLVRASAAISRWRSRSSSVSWRAKWWWASSHSLALISDAGHMLTDAGALVLSLIVIRLCSVPRAAA